MSGQADVRSVESLQRLVAVLVKTREALNIEVNNIQLELRRVSQWLEEHCQEYWEQSTISAKRRWVDARETLAQCQTTISEDGARSCTEQKKILERATERVAICERKLRFLKESQLSWRQESERILPRVLAGMELVDTGLPLAIIELKRMLEPLERYAALDRQMQSMPTSDATGEST